MPDCVPGFEIDETVLPPPPVRSVKPKPNETVTLRGIAVPLNSDVGGAFITDCSRNRERIFSDDQIREKYEIIDDNAWTAITQNKALRLLVNAECERRMLNNDAAREAAAKEFTKAPAALGKILNDPKSSPRHVVEASKELRATARVGDEKVGAETDRVVISINLGADTKPIVVDAQIPPHRLAPENRDAETE